MILIVSNATDEHVQIVTDVLSEKGADFTRFHTENFPTTAQLTLSGIEPTRGVLQCAERMIDLQDVSAVWYRRPERGILPKWSPEVREFATREVRAALRGLFLVLSDRLWVSEPHRIDEAEVKLGQLKRAIACGFEVPNTLVTNDPRAAESFIQGHRGNVIYKTLSGPGIKRGRDAKGNEVTGVIFTSLVDPEHLPYLNSVTSAPCLFQEFVRKEVDIRATVVGSRVFAAEIRSQEQASTMVDWRYYDPAMAYRSHKLPARLEDACRLIVRSYGLNFGALDLVRRPDGEYVFLEINPNGQWGWIQDRTGLPIAEALADLLIAGADATTH